MKFHAGLLVSISSALVALASPASIPTTNEQGLARRATVCNGHAELCERGYGTVTYVGTHNSYAIGPTSNLAANQDQSITQQLNDGIRMLQMQAHNSGGTVKLCHTSCVLFDGGTLEAYLTTVKAWLDANPEEVLTLLIVNIDNQPASAFGTVFARVGLDAVSYAPETAVVEAGNWPTLGELIDSNKRLLTFLSNGADLAAVPYLIDEFTNIWETKFNVIDTADFDCAVNRTRGDTATQMSLVNHFLDKLVVGQPVPFIEKLNETNAATGPGSLGEHVETCRAINARAPNFLLTDFYEFGGGGVFEVAAAANGVTYNPRVPIATPSPTGTGKAGASSTSKANTGGGSAASGAVAASSNGMLALAGSLIGGFLFAAQHLLL